MTVINEKVLIIMFIFLIIEILFLCFIPAREKMTLWVTLPRGASFKNLLLYVKIEKTIFLFLLIILNAVNSIRVNNSFKKTKIYPKKNFYFFKHT